MVSLGCIARRRVRQTYCGAVRWLPGEMDLSRRIGSIEFADLSDVALAKSEVLDEGGPLGQRSSFTPRAQ